MLNAGAHGFIDAVQLFLEAPATDVERGEDVAANECGIAKVEARTEITRAMASQTF